MRDRSPAGPHRQESLGRLRPGDHLCSIYRDPEEQMEAIFPFLAGSTRFCL